jgi:hypothetical protein
MNQTNTSNGGSEAPSLATFSDEDFRRTIGRAMRLVAIATVVGAPLLWWKLGWQSAALLAVGAFISGSGLFEWLLPSGCFMVALSFCTDRFSL